MIDDDDFLPPGYNDPLPEMARREADPIGYRRALQALGRVQDPAVSFKFAEEWDRPATKSEVQSFLAKQQISEMWDNPRLPLERNLVGYLGITREERLWLVERFISPATTNVELIVEALRSGYNRGRNGAPR